MMVLCTCFCPPLSLLGAWFNWFFLYKGVQRDLSAKDGFVIIVMFWLVLSLAGSIPFYISGMSPIDSFFESMSGITTTGATVISDIESLRIIKVLPPTSAMDGRNGFNCACDCRYAFTWNWWRTTV